MRQEDFLKEYNDVLLPEDIQKILHVGRNTAYGYLADGIIKSIKIAGKYRIPKMYLYQFLYPNEVDNMSDLKKEE